MKPEIITGAEITIRSLQEENVEFVFGYPGGAVLNIYDAIHQQNTFPPMTGRTEPHHSLAFRPASTADLGQ